MEKTEGATSPDFNLAAGICEMVMVLNDSENKGTSNLNTAYLFVKSSYENAEEDDVWTDEDARAELAGLIDMIRSDF